MLLLSSLGYNMSVYNPAMPRLQYERKATVVLFDWKSEKRVWQIDIPNIYISRVYSEDPVLLSNPEEGWALIQTGSFIKQILIKTGEVINTIPKQVNEIIEAVWIPSARSIYIARRLDTEKDGTVEHYQMP